MTDPTSPPPTQPEVEAPRLQYAPELHADVYVDPPGERYWKFIGDGERVYTPIPVTVQTGEMIKWPELPADDGCWEEQEFQADAGWTVKLPDNHPDTIATNNEAASTVDAEKE
jgi:hypothetical protein